MSADRSSKGKTPDQKEPGGGTATGKRVVLKIFRSRVSDEHAHALRVVDQVIWQSTDNAYKVIFNTPPFANENKWPFNEAPDQAPATIVVPAKGDSRAFTIRANARKNAGVGYGYAVDPPPPVLPVPEIVPDP